MTSSPAPRLLVDSVRAVLPGGTSPDAGHKRGPGRRWQDLTPRQRAAVLALGSVQLSLAATAWAQLATTPAEQVNGRKLRWALVIAVNWVGPLAWFRWGRRRSPAATG